MPTDKSSDRLWSVEVTTTPAALHQSSFCLSSEGVVEAMEELGMPNITADIYVVGDLHGFREGNEIAGSTIYHKIPAIPADRDVMTVSEDEESHGKKLKDPLFDYRVAALASLQKAVEYHQQKRDLDNFPAHTPFLTKSEKKVLAATVGLGSLTVANFAYVVDSITAQSGPESLVAAPVIMSNALLATYAWRQYRKRASRIESEQEEIAQGNNQAKLERLARRIDVIVPNTAKISH